MKNSILLPLIMILTTGFLRAQVNDSCINAIPLTVGYSCEMDTFSSVGATAEPGVAPNPTCGFYSGGDVWFTAVMPASGALRYEIAGISGINPQTAIYTGSCGAMTQLLCMQLDGNKTLIDPTLAGETLYFRIFNYSSAAGGVFRLCVWEPPVPVNNNCADAIVLNVGDSCVPENFTNAYASHEPLSIAPNPTCGFYAGGDVWFTATMPASGALRVEISPAQAAIYHGSCGAFTEIVCLQLNPEKTILRPDLGGETIYIRAFSYSNEDGGPFTLCLWEPPIPPNNDCENAIPLTVGQNCIMQTFTNAFATAQPASIAPNPTCGFYAGGDVWFTTVMPQSGKLRVEASPAQIALYTGSCGNMTQVYCMQLNPEKTIVDTSLAGDLLYIRAFTYGSEEGGPFNICLWEPPIPPNNDCENAIPLTVGQNCIMQTFTNAFATAQPASIAPNPTCGFYAGGDVWFTTVMPQSGKLRVEASPAQIALYTGSCGNMTQVYCLQLNPEKTIVDTSLAGDLLYIRAFTYGSEEGGPFSICLWEPPVPVNDNCENAIPLQVPTNCEMLPFTNRYATAQPASVAPNPSCGFYGGGDVWFTAIMPPTGKMIIHRQNLANVNAQWAVYSGGCGNMTQVACAQLINSQSIENQALSGNTLYIRVFNFGGEEGGEFSLCVYDTTCNNVGTFVFYDTVCQGGSYTFPDGTVLSGIMESMIDTSVLINEIFCDSLVITHLHVRPLLPALNLPQQIALPCETFSLQLDAGPGYDSYHWNTGQHSQVINLTQPGMYLVSVTGCFEGPGTDSCLVTLPQPSVSGTLRYLNQAQTPLPGQKICLMSAGNIAVDSTLTDQNGAYRFCGMQPGTYTLRVQTDNASGGINSIDALLILQHFTGLQYLSGLRLLAADVNTSNYVNASDALLVQRHFVELITTFPAGDWIFDEPAFSIGPEDILLINLYGLCFGDVNGSFSP